VFMGSLFLRHAIDLAGKAVLLCDWRFSELFEHLCDIRVDVFDGTDRRRLPKIDYRVYPTQLTEERLKLWPKIPALRAPVGLVEEFKLRISALGSGLKVGLCWSRGRIYEGMGTRSIPRLSDLSPLAATPGVTFVSLQKGLPDDAAVSVPPSGMRFIDWSAELKDFLVTAAIIESLDLVVSIDSSVANLAGAMGKSVWVFLKKRGDRRWLSDAPTFPTAKVYQQSREGDWSEPIQRMAADLAALTQ
jgi:hypothetical protein